MFYYLFYEQLIRYYSFFNIFRYITFRATYAAVTALLVSFVFGPIIIRKLKQLQVHENISVWVPRTHLSKEGTPTMGGIVILIATIVPTILWADLTNGYVLLVLLATAWMGAVGLIDDYLKAVRRLSKGLVAKYKLAGQIALGLVIGSILYFHPFSGEFATQTSVPFLKTHLIDFGWFYIPMVVLIITATSNAVNLTDGLDGLAIGLVGVAMATFAGFSYVTGHAVFSRYLNILYLPGSGELTVFCFAVVGASLGFLWYNARPAEVFMGDTGALALGGALGALAVLVKKELLLPVVGGVFVLEALSVLIQVFCFKLRHKRVFRMAPIHHHFELKGWEEPKVVVRFWIAGILFALLSLSTLKIR
ncbi:MAG TPA: phospho-N-acetylmuramoyl-pentapeptide-transferase [Candidatus Latescibacteria bacterium]|nr:phospho-N-acetylmuramoyl-pentapeptide-transferase [Candidatus Latescibacterota bacterium]